MANYKGVGFDNTNGRVRTGTSSDEIQFAAQVTAQDGLAVTGNATVSAETSTAALSVTGDASIGGSLDVQGDIISRGAVDLVVQDNFIDLNFGNTTTTSEAGGLTVQMNRASAFTASTVTTFVAGVNGVSNPTFTSTDAGSSSLFAAGDVVVMTGAEDSSNNGIYVVSGVNQASFPQVVTIKGIGTALPSGSTPFAQTQFTAATGNTASAFKTDIFVQTVADGSVNFKDSGGSAYSKGTFLTIFAANATESSFTTNGAYQTASSTLQSAYNGGQTILTAGTDPIAFTLAADNAGFSVQGNSAGDGIVSIGGTTQVDSFIVSTQQNIDIDAVTGITMDCVSNMTLHSAGIAASDNTFLIRASNTNLGNDGLLSLQSDGKLTLTGEQAAANAIHLNASNAAGGVDIDAGTAGIAADTSGALSMQSALSSDLTMAANVASTQTLTIAATNADGSNVSNLDIDADGAITMDAVGAMSLQGGAASDVTATAGNLTVQASNATGGVGIFAGTGGVSIDATAAGDGSGDGAFSVLAAAASSIGTSIGALTLQATNAAGGVTINAGSGGIDLDCTTTGSGSGNGALTVNAAAASSIDVAGANLQLSTTTSGEIDLTSAGLMDFNAGANLDIDVTGTLDILASSTFSIDGTGACDVNATAGNLTLSTITSGNLILSSIGSATFDANDSLTIQMDADDDSVKDILIRANNPNVGASAEGNIILDADNSLNFKIANTQVATIQSTGFALATGSIVNAIQDQDAMDANSASALATQQSIKAYVDTRGITGFSSISNMVANETIAAGDVVAMKMDAPNAGRAIKADANAIATCNVIGVCIVGGNNGDTIEIAQVGRLGGFSGLTAGKKLYVSGTAGGIVDTAPSSSGDVIFQIGFADTSSSIIISPMFIMEIG